MICEGCAEVADNNRYYLDNDPAAVEKWGFDPHPENCGCYCQHRYPRAWESMFSTPQPEDTDV